MQHLSITARTRGITCFESIDGQEQQVTFNLTPTGLRAFENYLLATIGRMHVEPLPAPAPVQPRTSEPDAPSADALYVTTIALNDLKEW